MEIYGDLSLSGLSCRWAFVEKSTRNHWDFIERSLWDQSLRDQLRSTEITEWPREFTKNVKFVDRLLRGHWKIRETVERSSRDFCREITESRFISLTYHLVLNYFKNSMETMATIALLKDHWDHGRPLRSLSAHWKTVERSVQFCDRSMVSQGSRLCRKEV